MRRSRGQVVVIFAVFILVAALLLMLSYFLYSVSRQKGAAEEVAHAAARAGCMKVRENSEGRPILDEVEAREEVERMLLQGLSYLPYGLAGGATPEEIVGSAEIHVINASPGYPQCSPFFSERCYDRPFVAVGINVPTAALFAEVTIRIEVEDAVEVIL